MWWREERPLAALTGCDGDAAALRQGDQVGGADAVDVGDEERPGRRHVQRRVSRLVK